jgi:hypothetical protein
MKLKTFKHHKAARFFDEDTRPSKLTKLGYPLDKLNARIDFEMFRGAPVLILNLDPRIFKPRRFQIFRSNFELVDCEERG